MKVLEYWKHVSLPDKTKFALIPNCKITDDHPHFKEVLDHVVKRKISYSLSEVIESRDT